jgi:hypothetical protein
MLLMQVPFLCCASQERLSASVFQVSGVGQTSLFHRLTFPAEGDLVPIAGSAPGPLLQREQRIVGSAVGSRKEAIDTLDLVKRGIIKTRFQTCKMEDVTSVFEKMHKGEIQGRYVLDLR